MERRSRWAAEGTGEADSKRRTVALQEHGSSKVVAPEILPQVQNNILAEMEEIIDKLIEKAKDGSCADAKFLFQFAGVTAIELRNDGEPDVDSAGRQVLRELMSEPEPSQQPEVKGMNL